MRKRLLALNIVFMILGIGLITLTFIFIYHQGSEIYYNRKYSESMRGYFAIEIVNATNKDYIINLTDNEKGNMIDSFFVDSMNHWMVVSRPSENSYLLTCIDTEERIIGKVFYVSSLPSHRYRIYLMKEGDIKIEIVKNDKSALEIYQQIIEEKI